MYILEERNTEGWCKSHLSHFQLSERVCVIVQLSVSGEGKRRRKDKRGKRVAEDGLTRATLAEHLCSDTYNYTQAGRSDAMWNYGVSAFA